MPIIRRSLDFEGHFTQIPNAWLRDERLSLRAKGLLGQLLSHSEGWSVSIRSLAEKNNCGRDAIRSAVRELEEAGYLGREQSRQPGGEFAEAVWFTSEPWTDSPSPDLPSSVIPATKNTNLKKTNPKKSLALSEDQFERFWERYPRKAGKAAARKALENVSHETDVELIIEAAHRMASDPNLPPKAFIPYPATWLNRQGWEDEPYPVREKPEATKPKAEGPERGAWKRVYHDDGDHSFCEPGDFGHE